MKSYEDTFYPKEVEDEPGYDEGFADGKGEGHKKLGEAIALLRRWEAWDMNDAHRDFQLSSDTVIWLRDHATSDVGGPG